MYIQRSVDSGKLTTRAATNADDYLKGSQHIPDKLRGFQNYIETGMKTKTFPTLLSIGLVI
jgi:hypothetical protein